MNRKSEEAIMSASKPSQIFTMNPDTIEQEKDEYLEMFKPKPYSSIRNFMVSQKVTLLYQQAMCELSDDKDYRLDSTLTITDSIGNIYQYTYQYAYDIKIGMMYVTERNVVFVINPDKKLYYENYISKTNNYPKFDPNVWNNIKYMLPNVSKHFQSDTGNWIIIVDKPCTIYPLREILNYYDGKLKPEYVASILTRLYNFVTYMDLVGMTHNGLTIDNIFFAPGKTVNEGEEYTVEDMRIVGVFGGWFFATLPNEKLKGMPREVYEILPSVVKQSGYSSFEVDELSIKRIARELLGDSTGNNFENVPVDFANWVNNSNTKKNAYEEFCSWERVVTRSFGGHRFVEMDVSID